MMKMKLAMSKLIKTINNSPELSQAHQNND
ncbi:hypothetical protein LABALGLTS371_16050 [Dellaglioa algida]|uniref:Uncharacterized protein n=1 Tax=Dellaglioa algida TaxID=105612 RepID=A0A5C6M7H9_9LACO|nr:hypothetical protein LABALGLTS371_16050 [Dellaglioa algida]